MVGSYWCAICSQWRVLHNTMSNTFTPDLSPLSPGFFSFRGVGDDRNDLPALKENIDGLSVGGRWTIRTSFKNAPHSLSLQETAP